MLILLLLFLLPNTYVCAQKHLNTHKTCTFISSSTYDHISHEIYFQQQNTINIKYNIKLELKPFQHLDIKNKILNM